MGKWEWIIPLGILGIVGYFAYSYFKGNGNGVKDTITNTIEKLKQTIHETTQTIYVETVTPFAMPTAGVGVGQARASEVLTPQAVELQRETAQRVMLETGITGVAADILEPFVVRQMQDITSVGFQAAAVMRARTPDVVGVPVPVYGRVVGTGPYVMFHTDIEGTRWELRSPTLEAHNALWAWITTAPGADVLAAIKDPMRGGF